VAIYGRHNLASVDPDLVRLVEDVGVTRDVFVAQGARTIADEQADILAGRSHLKNPRDSYHVIIPGVRDLALAVDLAPCTVSRLGTVLVPWNNEPAFACLAAFVKQRAAALGITPFSWGGDWSHPFDFDHFQRAPAP